MLQRESTEILQKEAKQVAEELRKKEQEDKDREILEHDTTQDNPIDPPSTSSDTITGGHLPLAKLGLVPFTPSKHHTVVCLDTVLFDPKKKSIVRRLKGLKVGTQSDVVTVIEKTIVKLTNQDPIFLASINIAGAQASVDNVGKLVEDVENYKERMCVLKRTLVTERGEG